MLKKMKKRLQLFAATLGVTITTLGCGAKESTTKNYILEGTLLDKCVVAEIDGDVSVLRPNSSRNNASSAKESDINEHIHYFDITNGETITDEQKCLNYHVNKKDSIEEIGRIDTYLTEEELVKANHNQLTNEEIIAILYRVKEQVQTEKKEYVKK